MRIPYMIRALEQTSILVLEIPGTGPADLTPIA
jgi:hypothetical protein